MRFDNAAGVLAQAEFFDICDDEQRRLLAFASEWRSFAPDEVIYKAGDVPAGAHVLASGTLKLQPDAKGALSKPHAISQAGSVVSAMALILPKPRPITITAVIDCETLFVPRQAFLKLLQQSPDLAQRAVERIQSDLSGYLGALEPLRAKMRDGA
jgi:CRP-like cAMP-binding protein